jgi:hypothetical protein
LKFLVSEHNSSSKELQSCVMWLDSVTKWNVLQIIWPGRFWHDCTLDELTDFRFVASSSAHSSRLSSAPEKQDHKPSHYWKALALSYILFPEMWRFLSKIVKPLQDFSFTFHKNIWFPYLQEIGKTCGDRVLLVLWN